MGVQDRWHYDRWYHDRWHEDRWYESVIRWIEVKDDRKVLYLHYIGWNKKWDEVLYADNLERVAKRNTKTKGPRRERRSRCRCRSQNPQPYQYQLSYSNNWATK